MQQASAPDRFPNLFVSILFVVFNLEGIVGLAGVNPLGMFCVCVAYRQRDVYKRQVIGSREKDYVAGLCLGGGNDSTLIINALRRGTGQVVDAAGRVHPADKALSLIHI